MNAPLKALVACGALAVGVSASTATLDSLEVDKDGDVYSLYADTFLAASPEAIFEVLTDYEQFGRISSVYKEYGYVDPLPDGTPVVRTVTEGCLLFYCVSMTRVETVEMMAPGYIRTEALPDQSDFRKSVSEWSLVPDGTGTRVIYTLEMEPDFRVPPVIGPWYLKRTLKRGGTRAIDRIERLAQDVEATLTGA